MISEKNTRREGCKGQSDLRGDAMRRFQSLLGVLTALLFISGCEQGAAPSAEPGSSNGSSGRTPLSGDAGGICDPNADLPRECLTDGEVSGGDVVCGVGTQYCRGGVWSACESIEYYSIPGAAALISDPSECSPCNPDCTDASVDFDDGDLNDDNSDNVDYDPTEDGIRLPPHATGGPANTDSDMDGIPDIADNCPRVPGLPELFGCPAGSGNPGIFHELPFGGPATPPDPCEIDVQVTTADVYSLMDTTGSMGGEIANLRSGMTSGTLIPGCGGGIIGAIGCTIPDAWFGVGRYDDYPYCSGGWGGTCYGSSGDVVYQHLVDIGNSSAASQAAVNGLSANGGADGPESLSQAMWAIATGGSLGGYLGSRGCGGGRWGWPCFRSDAIPIVIAFTDAPSHNGSTGHNYDNGRLGFTAPSWGTMMTALNDRGVKFIGIRSDTNDQAQTDLRNIGFGTGSVDGSGQPFYFSVPGNGSGLSRAVVDAVRDLADFARFDVTAVAYDNPATPGVDERDFVESITARAWGPGSCHSRAGNRFNGCLPGTNVDFDVVFRNDAVMPILTPQVFNFYIRVLLDDSTVAVEKPVRIVVPPAVPACAELAVGSRRQIPNVMMLIDQSGSMGWSFPGASSRWAAVDTTLMTPGSGVVDQLDDQVRFGLVTYTDSFPVDCGPARAGGVAGRWDMVLNNFGNLRGYWNSQSPGGGTPTGEAIAAIADRWAATPPGVPTILILATDGEPNGCGGDARGYVVDQVRRLHRVGIETYVVSVGTAIGMAHLNDVARAGQGGNPAAVPYVAGSAAALRTAIEGIIRGTISCELDLTDGTVSRDIAPHGDVRINGMRLDFDDPNGWTWIDEDTIALQGAACMTLTDDPDSIVAGTFPCPPVTGSFWRTYFAGELRDHDADASTPDEPACDLRATRPNWNEFTFDADTPDGTSITFEFRTVAEDTNAAWASADVVPVVVSGMSHPPSIDVSAAFRGAGIEDRLPYVQVNAILEGSIDRRRTPVLRSTNLRWTCNPDS